MPSTQFRFTVPSADSEIIAWVNGQHNLSNSVRTLIKNFVAMHGFTDSTCLPSAARSRQITPVQPSVSAVAESVQQPVTAVQTPPIAQEPEILQEPQTDENNDSQDAAAMLVSMMNT